MIELQFKKMEGKVMMFNVERVTDVVPGMNNKVFRKKRKTICIISENQKPGFSIRILFLQ